VALHAPNLAAKVDRTTFRAKRIAVLKQRLREHQPTFALCYGCGFREQFEEVVGAPFGVDAFAWSGKTLCVLAPGPTSHLTRGSNALVEWRLVDCAWATDARDDTVSQRYGVESRVAPLVGDEARKAQHPWAELTIRSAASNPSAWPAASLLFTALV
jgi:hypothetical protein